MSPQFRRLFNEHVAAAFDKQDHPVDVIGQRPWRFNMAAGTLTLGDDLRWQVQVLGTQADESNTWLWAWANAASNIPPALVRAAGAMRALGEQHGIPELTEPELPVTDDVNGHFLSMAASGALGARGYYRGPYDGGAVFLLITDAGVPPVPTGTGYPILRVAMRYQQALNYPCDPRPALEGYLRYYGLPFRAEGSSVFVDGPNEPRLTATFDHLGRLAKLTSTIGPASPPPAAPR